MIRRSTIQLLRFHFSFFLMPVYWFALSQVVNPDAKRALLIFIILHILIYPSSNGFNSYMDRDEGSIGGLKSPLQPTPQLLYASLLMDGLALLLGIFISICFTLAAALYILASRSYSARSIRLKKYPLVGYATVIICQGALVFFMVYHGSHPTLSLHVPILGMISASFLIGGFYPLTQIYQHAADAKDGVMTISALLGIRGTFKFCSIIYGIAFVFLACFFYISLEIKEFLILSTCMLPVIVYFIGWAAQVWRNPSLADFRNTMRMNIVASSFTSIGFILVFLMKWL
ncbi:MAG TPA: UbiA family prenyltransferase [Puia sp.]|jgi:1,4-dihydroxy-2-naphthoate octaprenyltransferase|nr:UbiA family prenyltransferase [Puia sp.]